MFQRKTREKAVVTKTGYSIHKERNELFGRSDGSWNFIKFDVTFSKNAKTMRSKQTHCH